MSIATRSGQNEVTSDLTQSRPLSSIVAIEPQLVRMTFGISWSHDPHFCRTPAFMRRYLRKLAWRFLIGLAREHDADLAAIVRMRLRHELLMEPDCRALLVVLEARAG